MRKIKVRDDLMSKQEYSKQYGIDRVTVNSMIERGELSVEEISKKHYIKIA
jgi:hypothetical protein